MRLYLKWALVLGFLLILNGVFSQVSIVNTLLNPVNVNGGELCRVTLLNSGSPVQVVIYAELKNIDNENLIKVETQPFLLNSGISNIDPNDLAFYMSEVGSSYQSQFVQANQKLPVGKFEYCIELVVQFDGIQGDQICEEVLSDNNGFIFLVNPDDESIIETPFPMLIWMHSEPFSVLTSQEYFRLILVELIDGESAQSGIAVNPPIFFMENLTTHSIQYPTDAPDLIRGKRYGWQVQHIFNEEIIERTDAWSFKYVEVTEPMEEKYVKLQKVLDSSVYPADNEKIFFQFEEKYHSSSIKCKISEPGADGVIADSENENHGNGLNYKSYGYNAFEIDLSGLNLNPGMYLLEVTNEKNELFKLKFLIK